VVTGGIALLGLEGAGWPGELGPETGDELRGGGGGGGGGALARAKKKKKKKKKKGRVGWVEDRWYCDFSAGGGGGGGGGILLRYNE